MTRKLSPTMDNALAVAHAHGGTLIRLTGGFWTYPGCRIVRDYSPQYVVPEWHVSTLTIRALIDRAAVRVIGWCESRTGKFPVTVECNYER